MKRFTQCRKGRRNTTGLLHVTVHAWVPFGILRVRGYSSGYCVFASTLPVTVCARVPESLSDSGCSLSDPSATTLPCIKVLAFILIIPVSCYGQVKCVCVCVCCMRSRLQVRDQAKQTRLELASVFIHSSEKNGAVNGSGAVSR